jgi:alanine dehydrogenase
MVDIRATRVTGAVGCGASGGPVRVTLFLSESDVQKLLEPGAAVDAVEGSFLRMAAGAVEIAPRRRLRLLEGRLADMAASDLELGYACVKAYGATGDGAAFVVALFAVDRPELVALIEADYLGRLRTGAASAVAAKHLAREGATSLGVIGCGTQAETQITCIRAVVPTIERVLVYCRTERNRNAFCKRVGADPAESNREAAEQDIVVTITTSRDPVLRGEWLRPGALVCAAGANKAASRELDNVVLERATFVCCDWKEQARLESADLIEPIQQGVLDWLEVHELHEVVSGELPGRQSPDDIAVFKSNGIASWDVAVATAVVGLARERKVGREL